MSTLPLKVDLHVHTADDPFDNIGHTAEQLVDKMAGEGFDGFAVTNHDSHRINPRLEGYAKERGLIIIPGKELTWRKQHIVLLNFADPGSVNDPDGIRRGRSRENLVFAPHPYFPWAPSCGKLLDSMPELFDAIEFSHLYNNLINFNRPAIARARDLNLPMVGTSDAHTLWQIGFTYTRVHADERSPEAVIAAIKAGRCEVVTRPFTFPRFFGVIAWMRWQDIRRLARGKNEG